MEMKTSNKTAEFPRKPYIKRGYYAGQLVEVKDRKKEDGTWVDAQYGHQAVFVWAIFDEAGKEKILNEKGEQLILPMVMYSEYKDDKTGEYRTALTKNSKITKVFMDLGWTGPDGESMETNNYVGKFAVLNINDYDAECEEDGKTVKYKASSINDTSVFEGVEPSSSPEEILEAAKPKKIEIVNHSDNTSIEIIEESIEETPTKSRLDEAVNELKEIVEETPVLIDEEKIKDAEKRKKSIEISHREGLITPEGYKTAMEQLENELIGLRGD